MIFNEDNLREGLNTFTNKDRPRFAKAHETYSVEIEYGSTPEIALERALAGAVKGLPNKDEKLKIARRAAGFSRLYDLRVKHPSPNKRTPTPTRALPVTHDKSKKKDVEKLPAYQRPFNVGFKRVGKWGLLVAMAILVGFLATWGIEDIHRSMGNDPQDWIPWVIVPPFAALFFYLAYKREKKKAKRQKGRVEHRDPSTTSPHSA